MRHRGTRVKKREGEEETGREEEKYKKRRRERKGREPVDGWMDVNDNKT